MYTQQKNLTAYILQIEPNAFLPNWKRTKAINQNKYLQVDSDPFAVKSILVAPFIIYKSSLFDESNKFVKTYFAYIE